MPQLRASRQLRQRKRVNYLETTINSPTQSEEEDDKCGKNATTNTSKRSSRKKSIKSQPKENPRIPIYKQTAQNESEDEQKDLYQFDESDGETVKTKKKIRKVHKQDLKLNKYGCTIQNILKNVMNRVNTRKDANLMVPKTVETKKQTSKMLPVLPETKQSIRRTKQSTSKVTTEENVITLSMVEEAINRTHSILQSDTKTNFDNMMVEISMCNENEQDPHKTPHSTICDNDNFEPSDDDFSNEPFFGFASNESSPAKTPASTSPKIKIISNIQLSPNFKAISSPSQFKQARPKANSTMLRRNITPWRFSGANIKRNPHFITLKEDSLPALQQDMVLDHSIVDKFDSLCPKTPKRREASKKSPKQQTVSSYFSGMNEDKENMLNSSLFDEEAFSPIKHRLRSTPSKQKVDALKRNVLGVLDSNVIINRIQTASTPITQKEKSARILEATDAPKENEAGTYFGFDSSDDELEPAVSTKKKNKPFRVSININDKKYVPKQNANKRKPPPVESSDVEFSPENSDSEVEPQEKLIGLFEDFGTEEDRHQSTKLYKQKKFKWMVDDKNKPKKKNKDIRTKEEEEEAEKWYSRFNQECEEIESFPLEID